MKDTVADIVEAEANQQEGIALEQTNLEVQEDDRGQEVLGQDGLQDREQDPVIANSEGISDAKVEKP